VTHSYGGTWFTTPDEAPELIREYIGLPFLPRTAAWRIARDGINDIWSPLASDNPPSGYKYGYSEHLCYF